MSLNRLTLQGRLTGDPELRTTTSGVNVANFRIAVERDFKNTEGERGTDFISCTAWRSTAEFIEKFFHKGDMILVDGRLQNNEYTDKDGNKRVVASAIANSAYFCGSNGKGKQEDRQKANEKGSSYSDNSAIATGQYKDITDEHDPSLPF